MQLTPDGVTQPDQDAVFLRCIETAFLPPIPEKIGVAVSGGGDSMAVLHATAQWAAQTGHTVEAVTVDHRLRAESAAEAEFVAGFCRSLGIRHHVLTWEDNDARGNLAAHARDARYDLMAQWALRRGIGAIALGHTLDDTAENFLIRLGRAAGVDGLAAMEARFRRNGLIWVRPFGQHTRADLRDYLRRQAVTWVEDPSNDNPDATRTQARRALSVLKDLGIGAEQIHQSSVALRMASNALKSMTHQAARTHVVQREGDIVMTKDPHRPLSAEINRRLWRAALHWIGQKPYPPRESSLSALFQAVENGQQHTIAGCLVRPTAEGVRVTREYQRVRDLVAPIDAIWDGRWRLCGPDAADLQIKALGSALGEFPEWRDSAVPRASLMASPAVWQGETLVAAPLIGFNPDWSVAIVPDFNSFLLSH